MSGHLQPGQRAGRKKGRRSGGQQGIRVDRQISLCPKRNGGPRRHQKRSNRSQRPGTPCGTAPAGRTEVAREGATTPAQPAQPAAATTRKSAHQPPLQSLKESGRETGSPPRQRGGHRTGKRDGGDRGEKALEGKGKSRRGPLRLGTSSCTPTRTPTSIPYGKARGSRSPLPAMARKAAEEEEEEEKE